MPRRRGELDIIADMETDMPRKKPPPRKKPAKAQPRKKPSPDPINIFGGPAPDYSQPMPRRKGELDIIDDMEEDMPRKKKPQLVKLKDKKKPPAGLRQQSTIKNHQEQLTKHGPKTVNTKAKEP